MLSLSSISRLLRMAASGANTLCTESKAQGLPLSFHLQGTSRNVTTLPRSSSQGWKLSCATSSLMLTKAKGAFSPSWNMFFLINSISIIFSHWTRTLDLIEAHLKKHAVVYRRIDGECPTKKRERILDEFAKNESVRVLIMTTGTGAVGYVFKASSIQVIEINGSKVSILPQQIAYSSSNRNGIQV